MTGTRSRTRCLVLAAALLAAGANTALVAQQATSQGTAKSVPFVAPPPSESFGDATDRAAGRVPAPISTLLATGPDLRPTPFGGWDAAIVVSTETGTFTQAAEISTEDDVFVDFGWANFGDETIPGDTFINHVILDTVAIAGISNPFDLLPFTGGAFVDHGLGKLGAGSHTIELVLDVEEAVTESDETNNTHSYTFTVTAPPAFDYGDAPNFEQSGFFSSYPTELADDGARHTLLAGFSLGALSDTNSDGVPSAGANGDDTADSDDEDGLSWNPAYFLDETAGVTVNVINTAGVSNPYLDLWIDFNRDGDWGDAGELVFSSAIATGSSDLAIAVPNNANVGATYARARLHDGTTGLDVIGLADDGEVEDYLVTLSIRGDWMEQGGASTKNGQLPTATSPDRKVTGAIHTVLTHPTDPDTLYIGAVNGGIWKTSNATATNPSWLPQTDFLGSLSMGAMAFDPTDGTHDTLVAGTALYSSFAGLGGTRGSVYRTTNGGGSWTNPGSVGIAGENISGIAARGTSIVLTSVANNGGIFRSTDTGANFSAITSADFFAGDNFSDLVEDESDGTGMRLYTAAPALGIYRSDDFGANWTKISGPTIDATFDDYLVNSNNIEMTVHPTTGRIFVAVLIQGRPEAVFYSDNPTNASPTWIQMDVPILPQGDPIALTNASNTSPIEITSASHGLFSGHYVVIEGVTGNTAANGFFSVEYIDSDTFALVSTSGNGDYAGGGSWTKVAGPNPRAKDIPESGAQGRIHFSIVTDPSDHDLLYIGGDRQDVPNLIGDNLFSGAVFRGDASIARDPTQVPSPQWDHLTHQVVAFDPSGGTASDTAPHADSREMVFDANGNLIEVDDGGVFRRTSPQDNTGDWFSLAGDLGVTEYHDVAYDPISQVFLAGSQDNGTQIQLVPNRWEWTMFTGGDGGDVSVDATTLSGDNQSIRYSSFQNLGGFRRTVWDQNNVFVSEMFPSLTPDGLSNFIQPSFKTPVKLNSADPTRLVIIAGNSIFESMDQGDTVTEIAPGEGTFDLQDAVSYGTAGNPDALYVGIADNILIRPSASDPLTASATFPGIGDGNVNDVVMHPDNFMTAFVINQTKVFHTMDAGGSWTEITGNLLTMAGEKLHSIEFVPGATGTLVVGADLGVFSASTLSLDTSTTWTEVGNSLPNAVAIDVGYAPQTDVLFVGTMGRGAWALHNAADTLDPPTVLDQFVFYNNSAHDGNEPLPDANDDQAIDDNKTALLPGQSASFDNYTSYSRGINGIMIDLIGLPDVPGVDDFTFFTGNDDVLGGWAMAPDPEGIAVRFGAGVVGSDRITLTWADSNLDDVIDPNESVAGQWLEVTVKATANTGLASDHVFYFGNAPGEIGDGVTDAEVDVADILGVFNNQAANVAPENTSDFDRDQAVNIADVFFAFNNQRIGGDALHVLDLSGSGVSEALRVAGQILTADGLEQLLAPRSSGELGNLRLISASALNGAHARLLFQLPGEDHILIHTSALGSQNWSPVPENWMRSIDPTTVEVIVPHDGDVQQGFFRALGGDTVTSD